MIEQIEIADAATYDKAPEILSGLSTFNYFFGSNGSGKTTITRVICSQDKYPSCKLKWKNNTNLQPLVYNRDFVESNFDQSTDLKGIFTLGEKNVDTLKQIEIKKAEHEKLTEKLQNLTNQLQGPTGTGGKKGELAVIEQECVDACWVQKQKHDEAFAVAFQGLRGSSVKFKERVLKELTSNSSELHVLADLVKRAETIFGSEPAIEKAAVVPDFSNLLAHEQSNILTTPVIGKGDVDIASMITKLGNSDWVREGRVYYDSNNKICPFCQQKTEASFAKSLAEYFDEAFEKATSTINALADDYQDDADKVLTQLHSILSAPNKFLATEKLEAARDLLASRVAANAQKISAKKKEPSQIVKLTSIADITTSISNILKESNDAVNEHNKTVGNLSKERVTLTSQVWKFLIGTELKTYLTGYTSKKSDLEKAIKSLEKSIQETTAERKLKRQEISDLEKTTTSIQPTVDAINTLLTSFGFRGFSLAKADAGSRYKLVRASGEDARVTLSEGERSFVTFLYFYHLLRGSDSESGITINRIVVFDDPVSSLDSDILFIVASLVKGLMEEVRTGKSLVKQVFVLTHNVYFHKEVTFNPKRPPDASMKEETFWLVRRLGGISKLERQVNNPIKTSYELLWRDVRKPNGMNLTIQNTLRRILENYFKILGNLDPDHICSLFEGTEKVICKSLFAWINAGSHDAHEDLYVSINDATVEMQLKVFKAIFVKTDQLAHYKMMMGDAYVEEELTGKVLNPTPASA